MTRAIGNAWDWTLITRMIEIRMRTLRISAVVAFLLSSSLGITPAHSQDEAIDDPWEGVEEMVVTSSGELILTKIATSAAIGFDAETLQAEGVSDIRDLAAFTPNLEIKSTFAAVNPTIFLRGVGLDDFNSNSSSAVAVYQDEYYMNSPAGQLFGLFDVDGIQVLLGPQPTLTNASAGAIEIRSKRPTNEFESYLTSTFGNYDLRQFEGALNIPLIPDVVAFRGSFKIQQRGGITRNVCPKAIANGLAIDGPVQEQRAAMGQCVFASGVAFTGFPPGPSSFGKDDVNDKDNWAARGLVSYTMPLPAGQEVDWLLSVSGGRNQSLATQFQHTGMSSIRIPDPNDPTAQGREVFVSKNPRSGRPAIDDIGYTQDFSANDNFKGEYDRVGPERLDLLGVSLTGDWSPSDTLEIKSLSGYFWHDRETFANDDAGPYNWQNNDYTDDAWQFSQEVRLTWLWSEESEATIAGYFLTEELDSFNVFRDNDNINAPSFIQSFVQETTQAAIFGSTHFELPPLPGWGAFVEKFSIDASVRYNWAYKSMDNFTRFAFGGGGAEANTGFEDENWTAWVGDVVLTYSVTEEVETYFKYSRGWKPGHFNANTLRSTQAVSAADPETLDSLELALRADWFDGRLTTNLTAFKYFYRDLQVFQVTVDSAGFILRRLINSEEADIWGVELSLEAEPFEGLKFSLDGGYLSSEYTEFSTSFERTEFVPGSGIRIIPVVADYSGNRLVASPEWSFTGSVEYTISSRVGDLTPRLSFSYRDDVFFDANEGCGVEDNVPECLIGQPDFWIFNATLKYSTPGRRIEVLGFVRNFLDKDYKVQSFDLTSRRRTVLDVYGDPRTFGVAITFRFD